MDNDHAMTKTGRRKKQRRGVPALWLIESTESTLLSMSEKKVVVRRRRVAAAAVILLAACFGFNCHLDNLDTGSDSAHTSTTPLVRGTRRMLSLLDPKSVEVVDRDSRAKCPRPILDAMGVYPPGDPRGAGLEDVVLLTASNDGHRSLLFNWMYYAKHHGLKFGVVAMDETIYQRLDPDGSVIRSPHIFAGLGEYGFGTSEFNALTCSKFEIGLDIMQACDVDVVFSDVDNVFIQDPFAHDLGTLVRLDHHDYAYVYNRPWDKTCFSDGHIPRGQGNTGFHYLSRKSDLLRDIIKQTLERCADPENTKDDQSLFWEVLITRKNDNWRYCSRDDGYYSKPQHEKGELNLCCLDRKCTSVLGYISTTLITTIYFFEQHDTTIREHPGTSLRLTSRYRRSETQKMLSSTMRISLRPWKVKGTS